MKRENAVLETVSLFVALIGSFAMSVDVSRLTDEAASSLSWTELIFRLFEMVEGSAIPFLFLFVSLFLVVYRLLGRLDRFYFSALMTAVLFTAFLLVGQSYALLGHWGLLFGSRQLMAVSFLMGLGYCLVLYVMIAGLFSRLDREQGKLVPKYTDRVGLRFAIYTGLIFLFWLPCLLICYPGSVTYDGLYQLGQYFGETALTNHHPVLSTFLMGKLMELGQRVSCDFGIFLYVLFQSLICAVAFGAACALIEKLLGRKAAHLTLLYYILVPTWSAYGQMFVKDTLFYGVFALFFLFLTLIVWEKGRCKCGAWIGLFVSGVLCTLLRNNGVYIVVPAALCLGLAVKGWKKRALAAVIAVVVFCSQLGYSEYILPAMGAEPGSVREMLSLPFQQTARYAVECQELLSEDDIRIINNVLDYETIVTQYDPCVSDPVKNTYHGDSTALKEYFAFWLRCGLERPTIYLQATLNSMFGYFLPGYRYGSYGGHYFLTQPASYGFAFQFAHPDEVHMLDGLNRLWSVLPGASFLNSPGLHAWILILCSMVLLRKRRWGTLMLTVPLWLTLAINCVSPVNGLLRYALPMMAVMPLLVTVTLTDILQTEKGD